MAARFKNISVTAASPKAYPSSNFYILKLNFSGDPVWVKTSKNTGGDEGCGLVTDPAGNIYVAGTFAGQFECDGITVSSNGKYDMFVMKLATNGMVQWIKNFGDSEDNSCNAIYYADDKLYAASSQKVPDGYRGRLLCMEAGRGEVMWTRDLGNKKGSIEAVTVDQQDKSVIVTGYIDSKSSFDSQEIVVSKYSGEGSEIWLKRFTGGFPTGLAITTDQKSNIFVTGKFSDSLRFDRFSAAGYPKDDIFLAKLASHGNTYTLITGGNSKADAGSHLHMWNGKLILGGIFSNGLDFGKIHVNGSDNSIFIADFESAKGICENMKVLVNEIAGGEELKLTDIYGKLLIGSGNDKDFLSDQPLYLEDQNGGVLQRTITDEKGDFSFKNIDVDKSLSLVIDSNEKVKNNPEIFLATQTGLIIDKISMKDRKFKFPIINSLITKLQELEEEDVTLKFEEFGGNGGKEFMLTERISYEPNSWSIPSESIPYLNKIALHMKRYSRVKLEINSHTDANGDKELNKKLSVVRGEEVKEYLVRNKVSSIRIQVNGHGEENIINRCSDNIKCSESEHAYNRRTEFRFYMDKGL
jgi:outer membrane protein OmpA-like peptidoglycan-associated protein